MARITEVISSQAFELIRDRIGEILIDEIGNQYAMTYDEDLNISLFVERSVPIDKTEMPAIVVSFSQGEYDNKNAKTTDGNYVYFIDFHTSAKTTDTDQGDSLAAVRLHKLLGLSRYILENPIYRTLGFSPPYISRAFVSSLNIADPGRQDALTTIMGRLTFNVRVPENVDLLTANLIDGYDTQIKIGASGVGYYYTGDNY